jgi:hypothetical protein
MSKILRALLFFYVVSTAGYSPPTSPVIPLPHSTSCAHNIDFEFLPSKFSLEQSSLVGALNGMTIKTQLTFKTFAVSPREQKQANYDFI